MRRGYQKDLDMDDLWALRKIDTAAYVSERLTGAWQNEMKKGT